MKSIIISITCAFVIIGGALWIVTSGRGDAASVSNVSVENEKQIVEIGVKGGYTPKLTSAKANMPTVLRMKTDGTFDCSSGVVIPSISYRQFLLPTGTTDIEVPPQKPGTTLEGLCVMAMYHFAVKFD